MKILFQKREKHDKWITCLFLCVFMMLFLFGCGKKENSISINEQEPENAQQKIKIVAVNFPAYDFARAVAGDKAEITMLVAPGNSVHSYEPTPQDMITVGNCDLFLYTGGESDVYIEEILDSFSDKEFQALKMMDYVTAYEEETVDGMQVRGHRHNHDSNVPEYETGACDTDSHEKEVPGAEIHEAEAHDTDSRDEEAHSVEAHVHEHTEYDEHVWTAPRNAVKIICGIEQAIADMDSENAAYYEANAKSYVRQIEKLDEQFAELFAENTDKAVFVGDRFPFLYFAKEYGITYYAVFPGCNGESEPSARTMAFFIEKAKQCEAKTIFYLELSNDQTAKAAAEAVGAEVRQLHSGHNVTKEDFENGVTYVDLLKRNYHVLREAF